MSKRSRSWGLSAKRVYQGVRLRRLFGFGRRKRAASTSEPELHVESLEDRRLLAGDDLDFGDAPDSEQDPAYPTLLVNDGARHTIVEGFHLGWERYPGDQPPPPAVDAEVDGQPSAQAVGDDLDGNNDDDGLEWYSAFVPGQQTWFDVIVNNSVDASAYLNGWIDLNRDGDFGDADEHFLVGVSVDNGTNGLSFTIPAGATLGETFLRLRLSSQQTLGPDGAAPDGEVEDYRVEIVANSYGTIHGQQWNDLDGDGVRDPGEPGLDGVTIQLFEPESEVVFDEVVTASIDCNDDGVIDPMTEQGLYAFEEVNDGEYEIVEVQPDGAQRTFPTHEGNYFVSLEEGGGQVGRWPCEVESIAGPGTNWVGNATPGADEFYGRMEIEIDLGPEFDGVADDVMLVHGTSRIGLGNPTGSPAAMETELVTLQMIGGGDEAGFVYVEAGDGYLDLAEGGELYSPGQIQQLPGDPLLAESFFDVFFIVDTDGGDTLVNYSPLRLSAVIDRFTPYGTEYVFDSQQEGQEPVSFYDYYEETEDARVLAARWTPLTGPDFGNHGAVTVFDFGDARDYWEDAGDFPGDSGYYPTLWANDGARHAIVPGIHLGASIDEEVDGQVSDRDLYDHYRALGDDRDSQGDDDDGVVFTSPIVVGQAATVDVTASTAGYLQGWINFNANDDYDWDDSGEQIFINQPLVPGVNSLSFSVPADAQMSEYTVGRFRFSTAMDIGPAGFAPDGEVEDYRVVIDTVGQDYGDAPDSFPNTFDVLDQREYDTLYANNGARHGVVPGYSIGATVDAEYDGQPSADAQGDDLNGDDEDGVVFNTALVVGENATVTVTITDSVGEGGYLSAWIDADRNGYFENRVISYEPVSDGAHEFTFRVPDGSDIDPDPSPHGTTFMRFRFSSVGVDAYGPAPDGEVEDYLVTLVEPSVDYGDAPYPYRTASIDFGPRHTIVGGFHLGDTVDGEYEPRSHDNRAEGDDLHNRDDDDGVVFETAIVPDQQTDVTVTLTGGTGRLDGWIDLNRDGDWIDEGEQVFFSTVLATGPNSLSFTLPAGTEVGNTYMRFRLSPSGGLTPRSVDGPDPTGEVEDYMVTIEPPTGLVVINEIDSVDSPGYDEFIELYDGGTGTTSLTGYVVVLYDGDTDTSYAAYDLDGASTDANGFYVLTPGTLQDGTDAVALYYADATDFPNGTPVTTANLIDALVYGEGGPYDDGLKDLLMLYEGQRDENEHESQATHSLGRAPGDFSPRIIETYSAQVPTPGTANFPIAWDYGDVPNLSFPTLGEQDGPRHVIVPDFCLGNSVDGEWDAQSQNVPSGDAIGDDTNLVYPGVPYPAGDEDGVTFGGPFAQGTQVALNVTLTDGLGSGGMLDAWVDFNGDGDWSDRGEQVFTSQTLTAGANPLSIDVPLDANLGYTFARFRLSREGGLSFDGPADSGEVEDYRVTIEPVVVERPDHVGMYNDEMLYLDTTGNGTWDRVAGGDTFHSFGLAAIRATARPVIGDWDGNGNDDLGLYNHGCFYLDTTGNGAWDRTVGGDTFHDFGIRVIDATAQPVVGDFDGDGSDDLGLYNNGYFYLDTTGNGTWDGVANGDTFRDFGSPALGPVARPVIGDWDGDGTDDLGLFHDGMFYLDTSGNGSWDGVAGGDTFRNFGIVSIHATAEPVIGDFDGDGDDDLGLHNDGFFYLDTTQNGVWDKVSGGDTFLDYGIDSIRSTGLPLTGRWAPPQQLLAAGGPVLTSETAMDLTETLLAPVFDQALARWSDAGVEPRALQGVSVVVGDLPGNLLGLANGNRVVIDVNAAGHGWFVDDTPWDDSEFDSGSPLSALDSRLQMDLLTVVVHELGHVLGYGHDDGGVMDELLLPGTRRSIDTGVVDRVFAGL